MAGDVPFRDLKKRLERHGWFLDHVRGSHHIFKGTNRPTIPIPVHRGKCKRVYEQVVAKAIGDLGKPREES